MDTAKKSTAVAQKTASTAVATTSRAEAAAALRARLMAPSGDTVRISNKKFNLPNGDTLDFLDVVIVDFVYFNTYYEAAYDENNIVPPNCFSLHHEPTGAVPSPNSPDKQCEDCGSCWANAFKSAGKGKACGNNILIAVLPTDATAETPFVLVRVSPTALKGFSAYLTSLARGGMMPYTVVSHLKCDSEVSYPRITFDLSEELEDEEFISMVESRLGEARERLMTEPDVSAFTAANDAKAAPKGRQLKAPVKRRA